MTTLEKGYHECPRCFSRDVYESQETSGAIAYTLNTPGPIDPTIINPIKNQIFMCRNCGEKANWFFNQEYIEEKRRRESKVIPFVTAPFAAVFLLLGIYVFNDPWLSTSGTGLIAGIGSLALAVIFGLVAAFSFRSKTRRS